MADANSPYFEAALYAQEILGSELGSRHFAELRNLAETHDLPSLRRTIHSWKDHDFPAHESLLGTWGIYGLLHHLQGIMYLARCECGTVDAISCNESVPVNKRMCSGCLFRAEIGSASAELTRHVAEYTTEIAELHKSHDKLVWEMISRCFNAYGKDYDVALANDLHNDTWCEIAEKYATYEDRGYKVSSWIGTTATNVCRNHFKKNGNRERLIPTCSLIEGATTVQRELMPSQPVKPHGEAPPSDDSSPYKLGVMLRKASNKNRK